MIEKYKLFENIQKAKKILSDLHISENDKKFLELKELLKSNLGYLGSFTKWLFKDHENFNRIDDVYKKLLTINNLDKPITDFEKLEDLYDYLQTFEIDKKANQVIKALPSKSRENVDQRLIDLIKLNIEYAESIRSLYNKKGGRFNSEHSSSNFTEKPKEFKTYSDWLYNETETLIKNLRGGFNSEAIKKKLKGLNVEIIVDTPDLLMVRVNDYDASCKIGSQHWCISTSKSMWDHYVNDFTNQYFVFDFTKDISDKRHLIGTTISPGGKITSGHWADDSQITDLSYLDSL
jgi:hypothetical protein